MCEVDRAVFYPYKVACIFFNGQMGDIANWNDSRPAKKSDKCAGGVKKRRKFVSAAFRDELIAAQFDE